MRTTLSLDDKLITELMAVTGARTKTGATTWPSRSFFGKRRSRDCLPLRAKSTSIWIGASWKSWS